MVIALTAFGVDVLAAAGAVWGNRKIKHCDGVFILGVRLRKTTSITARETFRSSLEQFQRVGDTSNNSENAAKCVRDRVDSAKNVSFDE